MSTSVTLPALGESVTEGTISRWLKQVGDTVEADEPLLEVSTDKVDTEIPSPAAGVLSRIVVGEDETAEVGSELAVIDGEGDSSGGGSGGGGTAGSRAELTAVQLGVLAADSLPDPVLPGSPGPATTPLAEAVARSTGRA